MTDRKEKSDQEIAEEVIIRYFQRSRDAKQVEILEHSDDEVNWIFKISFKTKKGYNEGTWGIEKKTGMVTNQLDKEKRDI